MTKYALRLAIAAFIALVSLTAFIVAYIAAPAPQPPVQSGTSTQVATDDVVPIWQQPSGSSSSSGTPAPGTPSSAPAPAASGYSLSDIATHDTQDSCWLVIHDNVYDVTQFIPRHPGGRAAITRYCGRDATNAFENQGHSFFARKLLSEYLLGPVAA